MNRTRRRLWTCRLWTCRIWCALVTAAVAGAGFTATATATVAGAQAPRTLQDSLDAARKQRMVLEAALERQLAAGIAERARSLSMSTEATALQQLEVLLDSSQARLVVQRDRIRQLRDAATQTDKAVLVILFRADAIPPGGIDAVVTVDGELQKTVTIGGDRAKSLAAGAADELYRAEVTPMEHRIAVTVAGRGLTVSAPSVQPAAPREIRYVEFGLKNGKLVPITWTTRASGY